MCSNVLLSGNRISAEMFQTSRTGSISNLTKVDGQTVFSSGSLLFDVKSCNDVQLLINFDQSVVFMDIYPNMSSQVKFCSDKVNTDGCPVDMFAATGHLCAGYTPFWMWVTSYDLMIGQGCNVRQEAFYYQTFWLSDVVYSIGVSSSDDAWWRLGQSACQPVTTPPTTTPPTTTTLHLTTRPATHVTTSEAQGSLADDATMNETMHKYMNMGRSGGTVCNNSLTVMTMVVTYVSLMSSLKD
ncbi:uncharacterized protein [Haliotis cracherodii]|uniref:uncharacterized protein n=1 Tax=Haliotis cracherodii TaxID=6455 RepID=UPI0039E74F30